MLAFWQAGERPFEGLKIWIVDIEFWMTFYRIIPLRNYPISFITMKKHNRTYSKNTVLKPLCFRIPPESKERFQTLAKKEYVSGAHYMTLLIDREYKRRFKDEKAENKWGLLGLRRFNRSVSFRRVCRYTFTLIPFLAMQEFNTFKTFCRVAETAEKPTAEKPTIGRCLNMVKNVSQTASIALPISGQEPYSTGEYKACAGASNQPQTQPELSLNLFPARQFVVSRIRKTMGRLTCSIEQVRKQTPALLYFLRRVSGMIE